MDMVCPVCQTTFQTRVDKPKQTCSQACGLWLANDRKIKAAHEAWKNDPASRCLCGETIPYANRNDWKYCSIECRQRYGKKRQPDPTKQITFNCATCGTEVTRWRGYGATVSGRRFCSNTCAAKHTKRVRHYVAREDDMVLDSTWEMLFAGVCGFLKVPVARLDRAEAVQGPGGGWYAPDFVLTVPGVAIEIKGYDDGGQRGGWDTWREQVGPLVVVDRDLLDALRMAGSAEECYRLLSTS